jgi:hypothetical protein
MLRLSIEPNPCETVPADYKPDAPTKTRATLLLMLIRLFCGHIAKIPATNVESLPMEDY